MNNAQNTPGQMLSLKDIYTNMATSDEAMNFFNGMNSSLQQKVACMADSSEMSQEFVSRMEKRISLLAKSENTWKNLDACILKEFLEMAKPWCCHHWDGMQNAMVSEVF